MFEIMDQLNQLKCVVSDLKLGFSYLKISNNETRLELPEHRGQLTELMAKNGCWKKPEKNKGLCMHGTILSFVILIIGVVLGSYLTGGLSMNSCQHANLLVLGQIFFWPSVMHPRSMNCRRKKMVVWTAQN
jgi:hypothetical protein